MRAQHGTSNSTRMSWPFSAAAVARRGATLVLVAPIHAYRWTVRPWFGWPCRHLPTCSDYALEAIAMNGPLRGFFLTISRLARCHPWGSAGFDPVPDCRAQHHGWQVWRYGRWTGRHIPASDRWAAEIAAAPKCCQGHNDHGHSGRD